MKLIAPLLAVSLAAGCTYAPFLRGGRPGHSYSAAVSPIPLSRHLHDIKGPTEDVLARLHASGGPAAAKIGKDGIMRVRVRVPRGQYVWEPSVIVMPKTGALEISFTNDDRAHHVVLVSTEADRRQLLDLPSESQGRLTVSFDRPGRYWFGCPVSNHAGRGMLGLVLVEGEP